MLFNILYKKNKNDNISSLISYLSNKNSKIKFGELFKKFKEECLKTFETDHTDLYSKTSEIGIISFNDSASSYTSVNSGIT